MLISDWSSDVCSSDLAKIAIDDTGAGHASLQHVFRIQPDYIKLDRRLVRHLHHDRSMRALLASAVAYAGETGETVIAEGRSDASRVGKECVRTCRSGWGPDL